MTRRGEITTFLLIVSITVAEPALASYIDPGSGHLILQLLGLFFLGALFYFKKATTAVGSLVRKIMGKK